MGAIAIDGDLVVRGEADGPISVMASAKHGDRIAFGVVRLRRASIGSAAGSPHVVVARARAWQTLAAMLAGDAAASTLERGVAELPPCDDGSLAARLRCYLARHPRELFASTAQETIRIAGDMVVRREHDGEISVIATVAYEGVVAGGYARVRGVPFEEVATSPYATLARGRAWQMVVRALHADPERAYQAAILGMQSTDCKHHHWRNRLHRAHAIHEQRGPDEARDYLSAVLDEAIDHCVRKYEYRARTGKWKGAPRRAL